METVAAIGKVYCRVFCHINSLGDKMSNTAATIQPNPFWFWENGAIGIEQKLFVQILRSKLIWGNDSNKSNMRFLRILSLSRLI